MTDQCAPKLVGFLVHAFSPVNHVSILPIYQVSDTTCSLFYINRRAGNLDSGSDACANFQLTSQRFLLDWE